MIRPTILAALSLAACASVPAGEPQQAVERPSLVVLITVDQLTPVYFERFGAQLTGGLARFHRDGIFYANGQQAHAVTETAPGHASIGSGRHPAKTAIFSNSDGVFDPESPHVDDPDSPGASPVRFQGTSFFDWMRAADAGSRVLSVSRKDRGAILPLGRATGDVFWWRNGRFTTSTYYADTLPTWLRTVNSGIRGEDFAGRSWTPLLPETEYPEQDAWPFENAGFSEFPHVLPDDSDEALARLFALPWMDSLTLHVALEGTRAMQLGQGASTDLLAISLSTTDAVGHAFGPDSREIRDMILRLDRWLGAFLDSLSAQVPRNRQILVLTSDHGVNPMPEFHAAVGRPHGGRGNLQRPIAEALQPFGLEQEEFYVDNALLLVAPAALAARSINRARLERAMVEALQEVPGVRRVFTQRTLAAASRRDHDAEMWRRSLPPGLPWLTALMAEPGWHFRRAGGADHSTMQPETRHVPIAFLVPERRAAVIARDAETVDIAPTLAALLGIRADRDVDGVVLREVVSP